MNDRTTAGQNDAPIIIYGAPRSGTTYLNEILNTHPQVHITHETCIFAWAHQSLKVVAQKDQFLLSHRKQFVDHLTLIYPAMIRSFYHSLNPAARYWGDKHPHYAAPQNAGCLETILELFPNARFVQIIRDGRDVVASLIRKRHADGRSWVDFQSAHNVWTSHLDTGCRFGRSLPANQYFELRYEDLIAHDVEVAEQVFNFLEIEMHPAVREFCQSQQVARTPLSGPTRDLSGGADVSDWKSLLSPDQQLESLRLIAHHLVEFAYEDESSFSAEFTAIASEIANRLTATAAENCTAENTGKLVG